MSPYFITSRFGGVHSTEPSGGCRATQLPKKVAVTVNQIAVYHLEPCGACFINSLEFRRATTAAGWRKPWATRP